MKIGMRSGFRILVLACFVVGTITIAAQDSPLTRSEVMVPMRDGVKLHTFIYTPVANSEKLPILFLRTPYGTGDMSGSQLAAALPELTAEGYIIVNQDIRGRFKSEGQFVMLRQPREKADKNAIDESTDTYDTIEYLLKNTSNNGRVGMAGTSYGAWLTVMAALDPHPALKAIVSQASPADMFIGDDFHHNGAFRLSYGLEYTYMMESSKEVTDTGKLVTNPDVYQWYLDLGPLGNADAKYFKKGLPTWNDFVNHPDYDAFWKRQGFAPWLNRVTVPTLNVAGWWDQEDFYGPITIYELLERHDTQNKNFLVVGPWNHGGWSRGDGRKLGPIDFGSDASSYYRKEVQAKFLAHYLKDKPDPKLPEALTFRTGANEWVRNDTWPPKQNVSTRKLYFRAGKGLSFEAPTDKGDAFDSYVSDPNDPVPYRQRPIPLKSGWPTWQVNDQRFAASRPDVLTFTTDVLKDDITVSGKIFVDLFASTSGTDSDWIVKLIDVYPDQYAPDQNLNGYELMIASDVFRGRYRNSYERPEPVKANAVVPYTIRFPANDHVFKAGHRIMVQVQSTWFPLIDRNPQRFVPNIFLASQADFQKTTQKVFRSGKEASFVSLPVVGTQH